MKSPIKIILIILAILQLLVVLYIVPPSIPKKIQERNNEETYISEKLLLSFDLATKTYKKVQVQERPDIGRKLEVLEEPESEKGITLTRITDEKYIEILNEKFKTLQNPFKARFAINTIRKDVKERLLSGAIEGRDFEDMKVDVYKGEDRRFILAQIVFADGHVDYTAEGNIGNHYYSIDLVEETDPEDIFRFIETATVIQN
jgi:prepilin-type processing-associated H-X9-DG protein